MHVTYAPTPADADPGFAAAVASAVSNRVQGTYRVRKHQRHRCRILLSLVRDQDLAPDQEAPWALARAERTCRELLGQGTAITNPVWRERELTGFTVRHEAGTRVATSAQRARIERVVSTMLPGRWRARWQLEADTIRFEVRPAMPDRIEHPTSPVVHRNLLPYGVDEDGAVVVWALRGSTPHMVIVGATGAGKTVDINGLVIEIARRGWPVWIVDPKRIEFMGMRNWPNVQIVATSLAEQIAVLHRAHEVMEYRYALIEAGEADESDFEPLFVVLDEYRDFHGAVRAWYPSVKGVGAARGAGAPPVFEVVASLARKGRSASVHLILGTQRPDADFLGGEALATDTAIPTPGGWTTMGDLKVGDHVFAEDGRPVQVTAATDVAEGRPCFRVTFSDRSQLVTDENHLWAARSAAQRAYDPAAARRLSRTERWPSHAVLSASLARLPDAFAQQEGTITEFETALGTGRIPLLRQGLNDDRFKISPVRTRPGTQGRFSARVYGFGDLAAALQDEVTSAAPSWRQAKPRILTTREMGASIREPRGGANWSIQVAAPLALPEIALPIDSWLLGYWLGDGHKATSTIATADEQVLDRIRALGYRVTHYARFNYGISSGPRSGWRRPTLKGPLRDLGLLNNKHIPPRYLRSSVSQRAQLLAGLLDSDGTCAVRFGNVVSGQVSFDSVDRGLIDGVAELAASLGFIPTVRLSRRAGTERCSSSVAYGCKTRTAWRVSFTPDRQVFGIDRRQRKLAPALDSRRRPTTKQRYVVSVEPVDSVPVRCITVDSPEHLYLAGLSFIPTHNCRDNFRARISLGRLSPQGAMMMWDAAHIGVATPKIPGRATAMGADDRPVEVQTFWTPAPRRTTPGSDDAVLLERLRADCPVKHSPLAVLPPRSGELYADWAAADLVPLSEHPELAAASAAAHATTRRVSAVVAALGGRALPPTPEVDDPDTEPDHTPPTAGTVAVQDLEQDPVTDPEDSDVGDVEDDDGFGAEVDAEFAPAEDVPVDHVAAGDLVLVDEDTGYWAVIETVEQDIAGDDVHEQLVAVNWRDPRTGQDGMVSLSGGQVVTRRTPLPDATVLTLAR